MSVSDIFGILMLLILAVPITKFSMSLNAKPKPGKQK